MQFRFIKITLIAIIFAFFNVFANAEHTEEGHGEAKETFNAGEMIMHHIADAHQIHFMTLKAETEDPNHLSIPLPIILIDGGIKIFSSSHFYHTPVHLAKGHGYEHGNYIMVDEVIYKKNADGGLTYNEKGAIENAKPLDFSITKTVVGLLLTTFLVLWLFISVGRAYKKRGHGVAPKGLQSLLEPLIIFVEEQIIIPSIGSKAKARKFTPFLLSVFFFIWIANLLGLMSFLGGYNVMGSLGVTLVLAIFVLIITNINGNKHYWKHIWWPDGVPAIIKILILVPIEVIQIVLKPAVLMIRLTANITAGHIIILAFTALIFIFGQSSAVAGYSVGIGSVLFMVFMFAIELLVAFLQAYVFTLLSSLYFGSAVEEAHH
ncbi:MAG: F0F1 ATP synthase subunit A [Flavobacteriales bacterium]|nr:F0F1 ATP synthase subunit A [Flavobacteriales bacterium]